ncbi:PEP-CTERM sorting domain-containing protein [Haloferula chungangensis]|uniref:PEP-CTERM sorting domain-containing protein n=1 Tax=Haloferula chungangensis TaxID=1048331 RepID=UPI0036D2A914
MSTLAATGGLIALISSAQAAAISWTLSDITNTTTSTANDTLGTGFLNNSGILIHAENFGGGALTHDGINFSAGDFSFAYSADGVAGTNATVFHNSTLSPLSASGTFGGNSVVTRTLTLGGTTTIRGTGPAGTDVPTLGTGALEIGQMYRIQLIVMDGRNGQSGRSYIVDGIDTDHARGSVGDWGPTLLATGTFVADATTQTFETQLGARTDTQINALTLHQIPEPSVALLGGLGVIGLLRRRRTA